MSSCAETPHPVNSVWIAQCIDRNQGLDGRGQRKGHANCCRQWVEVEPDLDGMEELQMSTSNHHHTQLE